MPNGNRNTVKKGQETEEREKRQIRTINRISLAGVILAAIIFLVASIKGISSVGFHMACFSAYMVISAELHEWIIVLYTKKAEKQSMTQKDRYI